MLTKSQLNEIAQIKKRQQQRKTRKKIKQKRRPVRIKVISFATVIGLIGLVFETGLAQNCLAYIDKYKMEQNIEQMHEDEKTIPTEKPIESGSFVATPDVYPNDDIPNIFSFSIVYDFSDLKKLDDDIYNQISKYVHDFRSRNWDNGEYDDNTVSLANFLEEQLAEKDDMSSDEIIDLYERLIYKRIEVHEQARTSLSAITLGQIEQDYADYLLEIYNETNNDEINNKCVEFAIKSVENFILGMSYKKTEKTVGDILYRMGLSYNIIASIKNNNIEDKCKAYVMANALYKLSFRDGYDNIHGYEALYNLGNNYKSLFTILDQHSTFQGYSDRIYYLEESYHNMLRYATNATHSGNLKKASKPMVDISKYLTYYYWEPKDVDKSKKYHKEYLKWKSFYEQNL